jgi:hypothetical protein
MKIVKNVIILMYIWIIIVSLVKNVKTILDIIVIITLTNVLNVIINVILVLNNQTTVLLVFHQESIHQIVTVLLELSITETLV